MNKFAALKMLRADGDSTVYLKESDDIVVTTDFSTPYIKRKRSGRYQMRKDAILVFSWTDDKFINLELTNIKSIKPLSATLGNTRNGEEK